MNIYNYNPETGEYTGQGVAEPSPLEDGVFLIPADATELAPPTVGQNEVAVFEGSAWQTKADFRGTKYWTDFETETEIKEIGVTVPENATTMAPPAEDGHLYNLVEGTWVLDDVAKKESQRRQLQQQRDQSLASMTHTVEGVGEVQTRPQDILNFQTAIGIGQPREWVLADNSIATLTVEQMHECLSAGMVQGQAIWDNYIAELKLL